MNTPTPRTDAAWAKTFLDDDDQCRAGNAATDMRDECATLERELLAANECAAIANRSADDQMHQKREAQRELATEREKVRVLREALENLRDEQNGAPLSTREEEWKQAMDGAEAALAATEAKP